MFHLCSHLCISYIKHQRFHTVKYCYYYMQNQQLPPPSSLLTPTRLHLSSLKWLPCLLSFICTVKRSGQVKTNTWYTYILLLSPILCFWISAVGRRKGDKRRKPLPVSVHPIDRETDCYRGMHHNRWTCCTSLLSDDDDLTFDS